ncbi:hypothetical protein FHS95_002631 [Sphingomonas naasensis]|uniref:DUF6968 domain-containing protein n=1 Tax=Sphingomonas naasensis TaxID=1344951 RepID=A0A4S1WPY4_9SPHN|nr:hypothetical protein [Sphingomonas naasensis]NIJ20939.1 hypothetical protein [Sphingomonas naasensis]TGX43326.1 hypothetical protein E5A74_09180 [Sphingomonas naasensis]
MADEVLENPIAMRDLYLDNECKATIAIGAPFPVDEANEEFWCHYQIVGFGKGRIKKGIGIDALQALCIALYNASNDLYFSDEYREGKLKWEGGITIADLGLPVSDGMLENVREIRSQIEASRHRGSNS